MKKYLIKGSLALVSAALMLTGCHDDDIYSGSTLDQKAKAYEETFIEAFGFPNANHTWGFGVVGNARTRIVLKEDMWDDNQERIATIQANKPADITDAEREYVTWWFENNPGLTEGVDIKNFFLQWVSGEPSKEYNVEWVIYDQNYMTNHPEATSNYYNDDFVTRATLEHLECGDGTNNEHILDLNANGGGPWEIVYIQNGSALDWACKSTWDGNTYHRFKLAHIVSEENGVDGWYVGLAMYGYKYDNGDQRLNEDQKDYCDDWILKIVPGQGETITPPHEESGKPTVTVIDKRYTETVITETTVESHETEQLLEQGRVLCEDLGSSGHTDIDFNDLVFDAKIWEKTQYRKTTKKITHKEGDEVTRVEEPEPEEITTITHNDTIMVLAAGGTLPLSFANQGDVNENIFGIDSYLTMVNTVTAEEEGTLAPGVSIDTVEPVTFTTTKFDAINKIPIWVEFGKETKKLNQVFDAEGTGYVPRCLLVPLGTPWARERVPIDEAYADFSNYVQFMRDCWDYAAPAAVFPSSAGLKASPASAFNVHTFNEYGPVTTTETVDGGETEYERELEVDQTVAEPGSNEIVLWSRATSLLGFDQTVSIDERDLRRVLSEGDKIRIYGIGANSEGFTWAVSINGYGANGGYNSEEDRASFAELGYFEIYVSRVSDWTSSSFDIKGNNFTLTYVTVVPANAPEEEEVTGGTNLFNNSAGFETPNDASVGISMSEATYSTYAAANKNVRITFGMKGGNDGGGLYCKKQYGDNYYVLTIGSWNWTTPHIDAPSGQTTIDIPISTFEGIDSNGNLFYLAGENILVYSVDVVD